MRGSNRGNLALAVPAIAAGLLLGYSSLQARAVADEEAKPAKKDNAAATRPAHATLTAAVEPAEAKAGDMVTFKVTAKLDPGYHIYKYYKRDGPVLTSFDFFDHGAPRGRGRLDRLRREPEKHKDINFPDLASVEYYEDEVTWEHQGQAIPAATAAGKKTQRCQAGYMICDDKTCSVPGRWTLPEVELTVAGDAKAKP